MGKLFGISVYYDVFGFEFAYDHSNLVAALDVLGRVGEENEIDPVFRYIPAAAQLPYLGRAWNDESGARRLVDHLRHYLAVEYLGCFFGVKNPESKVNHVSAGAQPGGFNLDTPILFEHLPLGLLILIV